MMQAFSISIFLLFAADMVNACNKKQDKKEGKRIVNGMEANFQDVPYIAQVEKKSGNQTEWSYHCAATMVSKDALITAKKCVETESKRRKGKEQYRVRTGSGTLGQGQVHEIVEKASPESGRKSDWVMAKISPPYKGDVIKGFAEKSPEAGSELWIYGWGAKDSFSYLQQKMQCKQVKVISMEDCTELLDDNGVKARLDKRFCTQQSREGAACDNDRGTGSFDGDYMMRGVVTSTGRCESNHWPALHGDVVENKDWIEEQIKKWAQSN